MGASATYTGASATYMGINENKAKLSPAEARNWAEFGKNNNKEKLPNIVATVSSRSNVKV